MSLKTKGRVFHSPRRSGNVIENKGSYASKCRNVIENKGCYWKRRVTRDKQVAEYSTRI